MPFLVSCVFHLENHTDHQSHINQCQLSLADILNIFVVSKVHDKLVPSILEPLCYFSDPRSESIKNALRLRLEYCMVLYFAHLDRILNKANYYVVDCIYYLWLATIVVRNYLVDFLYYHIVLKAYKESTDPSNRLEKLSNHRNSLHILTYTPDSLQHRIKVRTVYVSSCGHYSALHQNISDKGVVKLPKELFRILTSNCIVFLELF